MVADFPDRVPAERRAALLAALARSIAASLDLDTILQTVAEGARELCRSDLSAIALREPETGDMVFRFRSGERFLQSDRLTVQTGRGAGGRVLDTGKPFRSDDLRDDVLRCQATVERRGMELLVLDQTRPDVELPVVKVVVPGLRHFWARFAPGRLYDVPVRLGLRERPVRYEDLNPVRMFA